MDWVWALRHTDSLPTWETPTTIRLSSSAGVSCTLLLLKGLPRRTSATSTNTTGATAQMFSSYKLSHTPVSPPLFLLWPSTPQLSYWHSAVSGLLFYFLFASESRCCQTSTTFCCIIPCFLSTELWRAGIDNFNCSSLTLLWLIFVLLPGPKYMWIRSFTFARPKPFSVLCRLSICWRSCSSSSSSMPTPSSGQSDG